MREKHPLPDHPAGPRRSVAFTFVRAVAIALLTFLVLFGQPFPRQTRPILAWKPSCWNADNASQMATLDKKVPLEAHIMSKCPDALDCLEQLVLPTMAEISDRISFKLSYIGKATDHDDGVECKHGQTECLGNMLELCAVDSYPDPKIYLGFTMCMTRRYKDIPRKDLVQDCALEHGIDFDKLNDCLSRDDGGYAVDLLQASFRRSKGLNVTKSCTVRLNEKIRCIRDGGGWTECDGGSSPQALIREINELYDQFNSAS